MCKPENSVIPCFAKIGLNGIPTDRNLTEINWTFKTRKLRRNLTEIELSHSVLEELAQLTTKKGSSLKIQTNAFSNGVCQLGFCE